MHDLHAVLLIAVMSAVTIVIRFLPFVVFSGRRQTPKFILYLGQVLPFAMIGMLVVYCLKDVCLLAKPHGIPELLACALVVVLQIWRKNTILSILAGTLCYMLLIQFVFV